MHLFLFDHPDKSKQLWPLTQCRPIADLRIGILKIAEKWEKLLSIPVSHDCPTLLSPVFPKLKIESPDHWIVDGSILPDAALSTFLMGIPTESLVVDTNGAWIGLHLQNTYPDRSLLENLDHQNLQDIQKVRYPLPVQRIENLWELFQKNGEEIEKDFKLLTANRRSQMPSSSNTILGDQIFLEEGAKVEACILNSLTGPIYIGRETEVMEGSMIRGPFGLCDYSTVKLGAKIYGHTTVGPYCKVGGEIQNVIFQSNSNKAHDGYLGNSLIGEWCNIGADSNSSNLKNTYQEVKLWSYRSSRFEKTNTIFCGLIMGDHAKCGINTMFNTGTVVGFGANVFGAGYPRQFVPDFAWGGATGFSTFGFDAFIQTAQTVMSRRNMILTNEQKNLYQQIFEETAVYRVWENKKNVISKLEN
ncbi:MAG: glucose-1-phosphate thymidylyltransferase [Saprospiraceae bacterium]|nr:glucose-1-phosphate thymidylyltransferase [Saprospiraceae bacterium]